MLNQVSKLATTTLFALALVVVRADADVDADVIVSNLSAPVAGAGTIQGGPGPSFQLWAQEFTTGDQNVSLTDIIVRLGNGYGPSGPFQARAFLQSDNNGQPGSVLTVLQGGIIPTGNPVNLTLIPQSNIVLSAQTNYWFFPDVPFESSFQWDYTNTPNPLLPNKWSIFDFIGQGTFPGQPFLIQVDGTQLRAKAVISGGPNGITGTAFLTEANGKVFVSIHVQGFPTVLTPGRHGVHIHEAGKCDAPAFTTAGGHYDPGPFGNSNTITNHPFHMGDLPNLEVDASGEGVLQAITTRVTLSPSDISVFHAGGTAIIIHELEDQHSCQADPVTGLCTGVSGDGRLACGVIVSVGKSE